MQGRARGTNKSGGKVPGEHWNTGECQRNVWERVQSARGMLENAGICQGNVWKWVQTARGMQGNARGTYGSGCSARGMHGNAGEFRGMPGKRMGV